jgi:hypothetical protein
MPSDSPLVGLGGAPIGSPRAPAPDRWRWLRSQGLGLVCGFGTVLLLAVGSVIMAATREGASARIQLDDLSAFFAPPRATHWWLYLLFPLAGLYALNTTLATWENLARRWRQGQRSPTAYAAAVVHLGFLLALVAHGVGGFGSVDRGLAVVGPGFQPLPAFGEARLVTLEVDALPGGMPRTVRAALEVRSGPGAAPVRAEVGFNQPLSEGFGARLALLQEFGQAPSARFSSLGTRCELLEGQRCVLDGVPIELAALAQVPGSPGLTALVRASGPDGATVERWLSPGGLLPLARGRPLSLDQVGEAPAVLLRVRETPGNPWALLSALVLSCGVAFLWRRLAAR